MARIVSVRQIVFDWPDWELHIRDGRKCVYCGFDGTLIENWRHLMIDHVVPCSAGGADTDENKVVACCSCVRLKHGFDPSGGDRSLPFLTADGRAEMIARARKQIDARRQDEDVYHWQIEQHLAKQNSTDQEKP